MKYTLTFILSICVLSASAQFNTIASSSTLYNIDTINDESRSVEKSKLTIVSSKASADSISAIDHRQKWIDQYLSVSYPLKSMRVTSPYGIRKDPFTGKPTKHNGIDLGANNEDVRAMMFGRVEKIGCDKRSGNYIKLRHADYEVLYCHLSSIHVRKGQIVQAGEYVATSGNTGRSTGPHLHLALKYKGKHTDPTILFDYIKSVRQQAIRHLLNPANE